MEEQTVTSLGRYWRRFQGTMFLILCLTGFFLEACCAAGEEHTKQDFGENGATQYDFHVSLLTCWTPNLAHSVRSYTFICKLHAIFSNMFCHFLDSSQKLSTTVSRPAALPEQKRPVSEGAPAFWRLKKDGEEQTVTSLWRYWRRFLGTMVLILCLAGFFPEACSTASEEHTKQDFGENGATQYDFHVSLLTCWTPNLAHSVRSYTFLHANFMPYLVICSVIF